MKQTHDYLEIIEQKLQKPRKRQPKVKVVGRSVFVLRKIVAQKRQGKKT